MKSKLPENPNSEQHVVATRRLDASSVRLSQPCSDLPYRKQIFREEGTPPVDLRLQEAGNESAPNTPLVIQANQLVARLVGTGWLVQERVGFRQLLSMQDMAD